MEDQSNQKLLAFREALALDRGYRRTMPTNLALTGVEHMMLRLPDWAFDDVACSIYGICFEDGFLAALHRLRIVLGLPEARGREREAIELALDPQSEPTSIAARLRTVATTPAGDVVPFRRPAG